MRVPSAAFLGGRCSAMRRSRAWTRAATDRPLAGGESTLRIASHWVGRRRVRTGGHRCRPPDHHRQL